jgi:hypothetical protein
MTRCSARLRRDHIGLGPGSATSGTADTVLPRAGPANGPPGTGSWEARRAPERRCRLIYGLVRATLPDQGLYRCTDQLGHSLGTAVLCRSPDLTCNSPDRSRSSAQPGGWLVESPTDDLLVASDSRHRLNRANMLLRRHTASTPARRVPPCARHTRRSVRRPVGRAAPSTLCTARSELEASRT